VIEKLDLKKEMLKQIAQAALFKETLKIQQCSVSTQC